MDNLNDILHRLHAHEVEFVLVGGLAAVVHGVTLVARDVEICCRFSEENLMRIQRAVVDLHDHDIVTVKHLQEIKKRRGHD